LNTKTPESLLHVKKNEFALPVAEFDNPGTNGKTVLIKHGSSSDGRYPLQITTPAGSSYFDARGYLGLGVSPSYPLHVKNASGISRFENTNSNGDAGFDLYHSSKWWRIAMNAEGGSANNVHFRDITGSRYPLTLQSSNGYVGILNITPGRELDVTGRVRVSTLDTDGSAPGTNGTTKMVITDGNGDLSFANIPSGGGIDSTILIGGWGIEAVESPLNTWNLVADTTQVATQYDLTLKQDKLTLTTTGTSGAATLVGSTLNVPQYQAVLTSGTNIKTVNSNSLLGSGNVSVGTVTSVGITNGGGLTVSGSPVTGSGSITLTATDQSTSNELQALSYNAGSRQMTIGSGGGTPNTVTIPLPTTSSPGLVPTLPTTGASTLYLDGLGNFTAPSAAAATNLTYTGTASPITLNSSTGSDVTITAGSNITLSATAGNVTISSAAGGTTNLNYEALNTGGSTTYGDYVMLNNTSGTDVYLHEGDGLDILRSSANYAGYKLSQSYGQLLNSVNTGTAITATDTKINFSGSLNSGNIAVSTANDNITLNQTGDYEIEFSTTLYTTNLATRRVYITMYVGASQLPSVIEMIQDVGENKYASVSKSRLYNGAAGEQVSIQIRYDNAVGSGTDIYYRFPSLNIKRIK
jgi:hypothetical protein